MPDGRSLYQVTAILGPQIPPNIDQWFNDELGMIKQLVEAQAVAAWDGPGVAYRPGVQAGATVGRA